MPDPLTPEERAAIAAFPEERVQRIQRGKMALGYDATLNQLSREAAAKQSQKINQRLRELAREGKSVETMAKAVRMTVSATSARLVKLGLQTRRGSKPWG
jgi:hypothetical protein